MSDGADVRETTIYSNAVLRSPDNYQIDVTYLTRAEDIKIAEEVPVDKGLLYDQLDIYCLEKDHIQETVGPLRNQTVPSEDEKVQLAKQVMDLLLSHKQAAELLSLNVKEKLNFALSSKRVIDILRDGILDEMLNKRDFSIIQEYIKLMRLPETTREEIGLKQSLNELFTNFIEIARRSAEIIVSEISVPLKFKTFKTASVGGIAGGEKYVVRSVLLKISRDVSLSNPPGTKPFLYGNELG